MYKYCVDANIIIRYFLSQSNECKDKINLLAYNSEFYIFDKTIIEVCDVLFGKKYFCKTKENWIRNQEKIENIIFTNNFKKLVSIKQIYNYKCRDKNDDYLINQSLSYNLDGIISDDKDLKDNNIQNKNFRIISLSEIEAL